MPLGITVSPASDVPIFRQIMEQIRRAVSLGSLQVGEQLPPVRALAEMLVINPNTVARSYQELIREGVLESRSGLGVFVTKQRPVYSDAERKRRLGQSAEALCHEAMTLGVSPAELERIVDLTWKRLQKETQNYKPKERQ